MTDQKPELEFTPTNEYSWRPAHPGVHGLDEKVLVSEGHSEVATRLLRFAPGTDTSPAGVQRHAFCEEVYILQGSLRDLTLDEVFKAGDYACRPPGMPHGPWVSDGGCLTFEVRYTRGSTN